MHYCRQIFANWPLSKNHGRVYTYSNIVKSLQVDNLSKEWAAHADLPQHVVQMLNNFPDTLHPMSQFSAAITAMNSESKFAKAYSEGVHKATYWEVNSHNNIFC